MNFDWSQTADIDEDDVVYRSVPEGFVPRVTVGMPTFNRADTIRRALTSLAQQRFRDFVLVISDNAGRDPLTLEAVKEFQSRLPAVILVAQAENKGALSNFHYLLSVAKTDLFMWLADDDEITDSYLEDLVALLDNDSRAVTAFGYGRLMKGPELQTPQPQHIERNTLKRVVKFVSGPSDDFFFYGLHRTAAMRRCHFRDFLPPNQGVLTNWCYVFLFDMVLQGPIAYAPNAGWICHGDVEKQYHKAMALGMRDRLKTLIRRLNVYGLYCAKAFNKDPMLLPPVFVASLYGLFSDVALAAKRILARLR
ncbi:MAG: glycosyltransferase family 2 protein [Vulcanimicrobiota bacterium]